MEQTLEHLKAEAYDCLANKELWENKWKQANLAIGERFKQLQEKSAEKPKEPKIEAPKK